MERIVPVDEDIDVLFYGAMNKRRERILNAVADSKLIVSVLENCYSATLDAMIARAKIVLNLHYYPYSVHEIFRTGYLFANRKCVVTEPGADTELERLAENAALVVPCGEIAETCRWLAADENRRRSVGLGGYEAFRRRDFVASVSAALAASGTGP